MWTDAIRAIPLATTVWFGGQGQTPSTHAQPVLPLHEEAIVMPIASSYTRFDHDARRWLAPYVIHSGSRETTKTDPGWNRSPRVGTDADVPSVGVGHTGERDMVRGGSAAETAHLGPSAHRDAVEWMVDVAGLSAGNVADLVGVHRVRVQQWKQGAPIRGANLERILEIKDILQRAMRSHGTQNELRGWMLTPDGHEGVSPAQLLKRGEYARARSLSLMAPSTTAPLPDWAQRAVAAKWQRPVVARQQPDEFFDE